TRLGRPSTFASGGAFAFLIMFFGGMFCAYLIYRLAYYNEFAVASRTLSLPIGTINTAVLICSSLTVALSVRAAQLGKQKLIVVLLVLTLLFGLAFLGIKGYEWREKSQAKQQSQNQQNDDQLL